MLQLKAGYIDARPLAANSTKFSCNARPDHTFGSFASIWAPVPPDVGFSNRPFGVKRFQTIHPYGMGGHSRARASLRNRHIGPSIMGFENEVERSVTRPCR